MSTIEVTYQGQRYVISFDAHGRVQKVKVAYVRNHGTQRIGVLRSVYPSNSAPTEVTLAVIREADEQWQSQNKMTG
jgi:hypothetical protein